MISKIYSLPSILILALILRFIFTLNSNHLYYPDEHYQTLEPAYGLVKGYFLKTWEFDHQLRSYLIPQLLSYLIKISFLFNFIHPYQYYFIIKVFLAILSLSIISFVYYYSLNIFKDRHLSLFLALCTSIWYELIYFANRPLIEVISFHIFSLGVTIILIHSKNKLVDIFAYFLIFLSLWLRIQYLPLIILIINIIRTNKKVAFLGFILATFYYGLIDYWFYHFPFISVYNYLKFNLILNISSFFGIHSFWYYLESLLVCSFGILIFALIKPKKQTGYAFITLIVLLLTHSFISHKEYRFVYCLIPLILILGLNQLDHIIKSKKILFSLLLCVSLFGFLNINKLSSQNYPYPMMSKNYLIESFSYIHTQMPCDLTLINIPWYQGLGYFFLNQPVKINYADTTTKEQLNQNRILRFSSKTKNAYQISTNDCLRTHPQISVFSFDFIPNL